MRTLMTTAAVMFALSMSGLALAQETPAPVNLKMITIEVVIAQFATAGGGDAAVDLRGADDVEAKLHELEQQGAVTSLSRITLTSLDRSKAMVQIRQRVAIPTGRTFTRGRGGEGNVPVPVATSFSEQHIGTLVSAFPTLQDDGTVIVDLKIEQSQLVPTGPRDPSDPGAGDFPSSQTTSLTSDATVAIHPGQSVVVGGSQENDEKKSSQVVILASARIAE